MVMIIKGDFITIDGSDAIIDVNDCYVALEDEENAKTLKFRFFK